MTLIDKLYSQQIAEYEDGRIDLQQFGEEMIIESTEKLNECILKLKEDLSAEQCAELDAILSDCKEISDLTGHLRYLKGTSRGIALMRALEK